jgi:hypothetical protein
MLGIGQLECVSHGVVCDMLCCVDSEKTLINEDDHQKLVLRDKLCKLVIVTRPGRFGTFFSP